MSEATNSFIAVKQYFTPSIQMLIIIVVRPIAAVIGGFQAAPGRVMGHAGAWTGIGEGTSESKYKALESAGVTMVDHPAKFGNVMKDILSKSGRNVQRIVKASAIRTRRNEY